MTPSRHIVNKTVILNPKGGCGKSTLVTNLAARYAQYGTTPTIMDYDPQGSSMAWLGRRSGDHFKIHGIAACKPSMHATRSWQLRVPSNTINLLVDSPASISHDDLRRLTSDATNLLVPVSDPVTIIEETTTHTLEVLNERRDEFTADPTGLRNLVRDDLLLAALSITSG